MKEIIEKVLKQYPTARKIAVENFLSSMLRETSQDIRNAKANLAYDARLYPLWKSTKTTDAILMGINLYAKEKNL